MNVYFARQPIFDRSDDVVGYELLYRDTPEATRAEGEPEEMAARVLAGAVLATGIDDAADGRPAFVNVPRQMLLSGPIDLVDPARLVIEILETIEADAEVTAAARRLAGAGYRLALDDWRAADPRASLLPFADIVKVDVLGLDARAIAGVVADLRPYSARLLAEKVEDPATRDTCMELGFELFQGYYFRRPEMVVRPDLEPGHVRLVELLNMLADESSPAEEIEDSFRSDAALSYKLLRMANSAAVGAGWVESIPHALRLMGRRPLHRWLALLLAAALRRGSGTDAELMRASLVRARLCELMAPPDTDRKTADALFLVGLFSQMEALLRAPLEALLDRVRLAQPIRQALTDRSGMLGAVLRVAEAYDTGAWDDAMAGARRIGVDPATIPDRYRDALHWARAREMML